MLGLLGAAVVAAVIAVELRPSEPFGHGRHDEEEWVQIFHEDFDSGTLDRSVWNTCHWWDDGGCTIESNDELEWYLPSQVAVADGRLRLTAAREPVDASDGRRYEYRSGMVTTGPPEHDGTPRFDFTYGRVEARVKVPDGVGLWAAFWMLPSSEDSRPEIDILESLGNDTSTWKFHFHPEDRERRSDGHDVRGPALSEGFHDVGVDWEPGRIRWFIDGEQVWQVEGDHVPDEPMYLVANLAVGGVYPGDPAEDTEFPATYEIERVTVWQRST
jgi:beta-glucanase (GH16 family)